MGIPLSSSAAQAPATKAAPGATPSTGQLPSTDLANMGWTGTITAKGPYLPFVLYGSFNVAIYPQVVATLTTTASSSAATVNSATGLAAGQAINGANVPMGTTIGALSGTDVTLAFPPGVTNASVLTGADAAAIFTGSSTGATATIALERSFDGGATWITCGVGGGGVPASYAFSSTTITDAVCIPVSEYEKGCAYRLNCRAYTSGTFKYRISTTGTLATTLGIPGP